MSQQPPEAPAPVGFVDGLDLIEAGPIRITASVALGDVLVGLFAYEHGDFEFCVDVETCQRIADLLQEAIRAAQASPPVDRLDDSRAGEAEAHNEVMGSERGEAEAGPAEGQ